MSDIFGDDPLDPKKIFIANQEEIMDSIYFELEHYKRRDREFITWFKKLSVKGNRLSDLLPAIEELHPGFTENLQWHHALAVANEVEIQRRYIRTCILRLDGLLKDKVLGSLYQDPEWIDRKIKHIIDSIAAIDFDFELPGRIALKTSMLIPKAIEERKLKLGFESNEPTN